MSKSYSVVKVQLSSKKSLGFLLIIALITAGSLTACKPNVPATNEALEIQASAEISENAASSSPVSSVQSASPLANVMAAFISTTPTAWNAFDHVADIKWRDASAVLRAGKNDKKGVLVRNGTLLLQGFGEIPVPDGKVGAAAGIKNENEGLSALSLSGSDTEVETIAISKFRPNDNYAEVISRQFSNDVTLTLIAKNCANEYSRSAGNNGNYQFFRLNFSNNRAVYMEGSVDKDGGNSGPGYTAYIFYRTEPIDRIKQMSCQQI